jgi:hypothetical protein
MKVLHSVTPTGKPPYTSAEVNSFFGTLQSLKLKGGGAWFKTTIAANQIVNVTEVTESNYRSLGKSLGYAAAGTVLLGPIGLIGGAIIGALKKHRAILAIEFINETKIVVEASPKEARILIKAAIANGALELAA